MYSSKWNERYSYFARSLVTSFRDWAKSQYTTIREYCLQISPKNCSLLIKKFKYVGHIVSEHGIEPDPDKTSRVKNLHVPTNSGEARQSLGFAWYYRILRLAGILINVMVVGKKSRKNKQKTHPKWRKKISKQHLMPWKIGWIYVSPI